MRSSIVQPLRWGLRVLIDVVQGDGASELSRDNCFDPKKSLYTTKLNCLYHCDEITAKYCEMHFESIV